MEIFIIILKEIQILVLYLNLKVFKPDGFKLLFSLSVNLTIIFSFGFKTASAALQFSTHRDIFKCVSALQQLCAASWTRLP